jgi:hypothetical protein
MNDFEQDLRRQLKSEADDVLFENLHFDSRLHDQVLDKASQERKPFILRKWFHKGRKMWGYGASAAVGAILGILLVSSPLFDNEAVDVNPTAPAATYEIFVTPTLQTWSPQSPEEAAASFGSGLLVPSYTPEQVPLSGIQASGEEKGEATKMVFHYMYGELSFMVMAEKGPSPLVFDDEEKVDINGNAGYLKTGNADTELHWSVDGVHYTIIGVISGAEAVKVAQSMK